MALRLNGSNTGYVELDVPADAGSHTLTLPDGGGSSGQYLQTDGSGGLSWQTVTDTTTNLTWTATQSNTGTTITFSSIPSNARRITIIFSEVSTNSTGVIRIRAGHSSGTFITSGYNTDYHWYNGGGGQGGFSTAFTFGAFQAAAWIWNGTMYLHRSNDNTWIMTSSAHYNDQDGATVLSNGRLVMGSNVLDAIQIDANTGSFDDGWIGFGYEV